MKTPKLALVVTLIAALAATACAGSPADSQVPSAPDGPTYTMVMFDGTAGSPLNSDKVASAARATAEAAAVPGGVVEYWVLGATLAESRPVHVARFEESTSRMKQKIQSNRKRFIEGTVATVTGIVDGVLVARPHTTPLAEGISKMLRARPRGVPVRAIVITDMLQFGDGLDFEFGPIPSDATFAKWCAARGLLQTHSATDVSVMFAGVDLSRSDDRAPAVSMARQARIEQLWTATLKNAGATDVTVTAGILGTNRVTRPRKRRKGSLLENLFGFGRGADREPTYSVTRVEHLPEPHLGVSLYHYIVSIIGPRPVHAPDTNPRHQRAVRDAMIGPEVEAQKRVVDEIAIRRTQWFKNRVYLTLIAFGAAAELIMSEQLFYHLGIDRPLSIILAIGQTILLVAMLTILTRTKHKGIAWGVCFVLLLTVGALAILRANEMAAEDDTTALESAAKTIVLVLGTAGPAFFIEWILGSYTQAAKVDRELRVEEDKLAEIAGRMEAGRAYDERSYQAVVAYDALYKQVAAKALAEYPNHFKDQSVPAPDAGIIVAGKEDSTYAS
ncbi:MAG: hypothetical protein KA072_01865 [Thermoanaerobaculaceae bacterium]|nr:hypothetical protein [Thermoanaerobaculaceae bacterium]MDI9621627.1 hypothetical protein [Acidobacteriota bacterium]